MSQEVISGRGALMRIERLTTLLQIRHPLLVCAKEQAERFPIRAAAVFDAFHPNPDFADCAAGAALYREAGCDGLISLGGGSTIDTAKVIKALLIAKDPEKVKANLLPTRARLPHIAIPTTAGTGSEATAVAVMYVDGQKLSLNHEQLVPNGVILDGSLLDTLPEYHKKSCALDAFCQGVESFWACKATDVSRMHARAAFNGVLGAIDAYLAGEAAAADAMMNAAWESGRAIRITATTAAHAMSYQITKKIGYAHGHACMLTLPILWARLLAEQPERMHALASAMNLSDPADGPLLARGLLLALDMQPKEMPDAAMLDYLANTVNVERLSNHPQHLTRDDLRAIYAEAFSPVDDEEQARCLAVWRTYGK